MNVDSHVRHCCLWLIALFFMLVVGCDERGDVPPQPVFGLVVEPANCSMGRGKNRDPQQVIDKIKRDHAIWLRDGKVEGQGHLGVFCGDLSGLSFSGADLRGAYFNGANLTGTDFSDANLEEANLPGTNLSGANLSGANLLRANLTSSNLTRADLSRASLDSANLDAATLNFASFGIVPRSLPDIGSLATANGLSELSFSFSPHALMELQEAFKKAGMRRQEREVTYARKFLEGRRALNSADWSDKVDGLFNLIFFELPSNYGMDPGKALRLLGVVILVFVIPYACALMVRGPGGIWITWPQDRVMFSVGDSEPTRATPEAFFLNLRKHLREKQHLRKFVPILNALTILGVSSYFSLLTSLRIGWRDLSLGTWLVRIQTREYLLRPTGWVRLLAGLQSLISVYLIGLWAMTYFGRPFE